jgi:hypothetical protein
MSKEAMLTAEVAVLTELVRVLSDKVNELQILNQPTWFIDSKHTTPQQRTWVGLTDEEISKLQHLIDWTAHWSYGTFAQAIEAKLKEKNT